MGCVDIYFDMIEIDMYSQTGVNSSCTDVDE